MNKEIKLNLGCGRSHKKGYINVDVSSEVKPDKIWDLEKVPLPFKDNSISEIVIEHAIEHVRNFIPLMHDLRRICENSAKIEIKVPFYTGHNQFMDPTHVRFFTPFTFDYFKKGAFSHEVNCKEDMFEVEKVKINFGFGRSSKLNFIINPLINFNHLLYCRFFAWILPSAEIYYRLKVIKSNC
ncbi:MAG: hypothetical protein U9Q06_03385 [Nanoarchaeota archaeon]|nr:hypothetical protein [Nanoarchaeota archaeon]